MADPTPDPVADPLKVCGCDHYDTQHIATEISGDKAPCQVLGCWALNTLFELSDAKPNDFDGDLP
jgi:hypothetical protein